MEPGLVREKLTAMTITTDTAIQSVQKIATDLRPVVLDSLGLCAAIEWQAQDFQARTGIRCEARLPAEDPPLDRERSTALFRILQESLTNVARHAAASRVEILLRRDAGQITLVIQDNGRGIRRRPGECARRNRAVGTARARPAAGWPMRHQRPAGRRNQSRSTAAAAAAGPIRGQAGMRILIADDHAILRGGLKQLLALEIPGAVFGEADTYQETLAQG